MKTLFYSLFFMIIPATAFCGGGGLSVNVINITNASCNGINNGAATVTGTGGAGGYSYSWSPSGGTAPTATGLAPGVYTVTVTDAAFATATASITIGENSPINIITDSMSNYLGYAISCFGDSDGWIYTSSSGGIMAGTDSVTYNYTGAPQLYIVPAGITQVTIKAWGAQGGANWVNNTNYGGYAKGNLAVTPGETLYVYVGEQPLSGVVGGYNGGGSGDGAGKGGGGASDVRQGGNTLNDRKIVAAGAGGAGYWSSLHVVGGIGGGLTGGDGYRNTTADMGGLGATQTAGGANGTCVNFNVTSMAGSFGQGGTPLGYFCGCEGYGGGGGWYGGAGSGNCRGGGGGSSYIDGVTDSITIGGVNMGHGKVVILFSAPEPLSYLWSTGDTSEYETGLNAGTYTYTVSSLSGCTASVTYVLNEPDQLDPNFTTDPVSCFGLADGSISVNVSGGVSPYQYLWENSDTTANINSLPAGMYTVLVTDANGCTYLDSTAMTEPIQLNLSATSVAESLGSDGSINLTVTGGTAPYNITWSNSATTEDLSGLAGGSYTATVVDTNGCMDSITVLVSSTFSISENEAGGFSVYPNPTSGIVYIKGDGSVTGEYILSVMDIRGRTIYTSEGSMKNALITIQTQEWSAGTYVIQLDMGAHHFVRRLVVE